jgi:hypothetical protein
MSPYISLIVDPDVRPDREMVGVDAILRLGVKIVAQR